MIRYDYRGRVALVTGGTSGIGLATALAFARAGASVAVVARGEEAGRATEAALAREGVPALFARADVTDDAALARAFAEVDARFGRLDFAVNCAGAGGALATVETTEQSTWDAVMAANARGTWLSMRHELAAMRGPGAIVNMSSIYGLAGRAAYHAYVAAKHAVVGLTKSVALEVAARGIRVNAICAGVTRTPGMAAAEAVAPELVRDLVAAHPVGRMASEAEIAGAALWLCSEAAGYVTGAPLAVDGGFLAA